MGPELIAVETDTALPRRADVVIIGGGIAGVSTLLSLAERVGFDWGFLLAGTATVTLLSANAGWIFSSREQGWKATAIFTLLYALIYMLLRLEDNALLVGAIASFLAVAVAMYFTRTIDWYSSLPAPRGNEPPPPPPVPRSAA